MPAATELSQLDRIEAAVKALAAERALLAPVLTTPEAIAYTKHGSASAFNRWAQKWGVRNSQNGRWPRQRLDKGLYAEAHTGGSKRARRGSVGGAAVERIAA